MDTEQLFQELGRLPHRGTGTPEEERAFEAIGRFFRSRGFTPQITPFPCPRSYGWELLSICALLGLGGLLPFPPLVLLGSLWFFLYFSGLGTPWDHLFARGTSRNLRVAAGNGCRHLLLMAHLDSAKTALFFHPRIVRFFRLQFLLQTTLVLLLIPFALFSFLPGARILGGFFLLQAGLWLVREGTAPYVQGASDNLSGVRVALELFLKLQERPLPDTTVTLLLTGGEEVGMKGARAFLLSDPPLPHTVVLNIDNVGAGELFAVTGEGMFWVTPYPGALPERVAPRHLPTTVYRLAYFDALPFARRGYETLTLVRLRHGVPPHWHWETDTLENLEPGALEETIRIAHTLLSERFSL